MFTKAAKKMELPMEGIQGNFFEHSYISCHSFVVKIGLLSKMSRFFIFHANFYWPRVGCNEIIEHREL